MVSTLDDGLLKSYNERVLLKNRQKTILNAVIREHIATARPVSSHELNREFGLGVSSATIRNEMFGLDRLGYLEQPHTSSGRIPTDLGYRFFVDYLIDSADLSGREKKLLNQIFKDCVSSQSFVRELTKAASDFLGTFSIGGIFGDESIIKTGFARVLEEPEFDDHRRARTFGQFVDNIDEGLRRLLDELDDGEEKIFIGEENPLEEANTISMLMSSWKHPRGFRGFITVIGPKRIDYQKYISFLHYLQNV